MKGMEGGRGRLMECIENALHVRQTHSFPAECRLNTMHLRYRLAWMRGRAGVAYPDTGRALVTTRHD